jgi:pyrroline-5-carboxylate reductase
MGEMVLGGLITHGTAPSDVTAAVRRPEQAAHLSDQYGVSATDAATATATAEVLVLAVKPQDMAALLDEIAPVVRSGVVVISLAAGLPATFFEARLPGARVVRTMPNTPGRVGAGVTAIAPGASADAAAVAITHQILETVGIVVDVAEAQLDLVTAVSGSGPAYVFLLAEALHDAAVELGLAPDLAARLVRQTVIGAAALLDASEATPEALRASVTSKKGTTDAAITVLEDRGARAAMVAALEAAVARAKELSAQA